MQDGIDSSCIKMGAILSIFLMLFSPFPAVSEPTLSGSIPRLPLLFVCQTGTISPALAGRSPPIQAGEGAVLMYCSRIYRQYPSRAFSNEDYLRMYCPRIYRQYPSAARTVFTR